MPDFPPFTYTMKAVRSAGEALAQKLIWTDESLRHGRRVVTRTGADQREWRASVRPADGLGKQLHGSADDCRSQPSSQAASDGSDRPSSKTTQGNMPSITFMSDAMRKPRSSILSLAGAYTAAHSQPPSAEPSRQ